MKNLAQRLARALLGDYSLYYIYTAATTAVPAAPAETFEIVAVDQSTLLASAEPLIHEQAGYAGQGARAYACYDQGRIAAVCFYWWGRRYLERNFWPLREHEAKLVQIVTVPELRSRGAAATLIAASCRDMAQQGFERTYARIWHSNIPSLRAFERAGWRRAALVVEINPLRRQRPLRLRFGLRGGRIEPQHEVTA